MLPAPLRCSPCLSRLWPFFCFSKSLRLREISPPAHLAVTSLRDAFIVSHACRVVKPPRFNQGYASLPSAYEQSQAPHQYSPKPAQLLRLTPRSIRSGRGRRGWLTRWRESDVGFLAKPSHPALLLTFSYCATSKSDTPTGATGTNPETASGVAMISGIAKLPAGQ